MCRKIIAFLFFIMVISCDNPVVFSAYTSLDEPWKKNEKIQFTFQITDTIKPHDVFITIRNDEKYTFSNLFLITTLDSPDGDSVTDTLEYVMAKADGTWLGKGFTSVKESKLWYKESLRFPTTGAYHISLEHAMRKNGAITGVMALEGITDLGIRIEIHND